jgi:hypothetical protein
VKLGGWVGPFSLSTVLGRIQTFRASLSSTEYRRTGGGGRNAGPNPPSSVANSIHPIDRR